MIIVRHIQVAAAAHLPFPVMFLALNIVASWGQSRTVKLFAFSARRTGKTKIRRMNLISC